MRYVRDDATRWVWIIFGLTQATVTMLMAFDVLDSPELPQAITAVALVIYVAVNELWAKPMRSKPKPDAQVDTTQVQDQPPS
jgi:membrane protein YdbS with pleckstrin-like domain